jgi:hypothetical protein
LLGFAGVRAGVPPVVLMRSLYTIYSTCLPPYNVVRPGASSHCERRPRHLRLCACCLRFRVMCVVCVSACWISSVVCVVCVVRFPTLPTRRAMRTLCPRSARCITACHARTNMYMCKVGWCACVAWHATHASHARIFFYRCKPSSYPSWGEPFTGNVKSSSHPSWGEPPSPSTAWKGVRQIW